LFSARHASEFHEPEQPANAIGRNVPGAIPESLAGLPEPGSRDIELVGDAAHALLGLADRGWVKENT